MENEEKEDLLYDITEESESDLSDCSVQEKIINFLELNKKPTTKLPKALKLYILCVILFISTSIVVITFPIYSEQAKRCDVSTYSQIFTLSLGNLLVLGVLCFVKKLLLKCSLEKNASKNLLYLNLPNALKLSVLSVTGCVTLTWLADEKFLSCHLQDPLKGCAVVFSLLSYFIFAKKRLSSERVFCVLTVIVGTFVTVDFGLCDRYRCHGAILSSEVADTTPHYHGLFITCYILAIAAFSIYFTLLENCCQSHYSSNLDMSIVRSDSIRGDCISTAPFPSNQSLSIISGSRGSRRPQTPLTIPTTSSRALIHEYPVTSTPNELPEPWTCDSWDWLAAQHFLVWCLVVLLCWIPAAEHSEEPKYLVHVFHEVYESFKSHGALSDCCLLWLPSSLLIGFYVVACLSAMSVLMASQSAVLVVCVIVNALPMASLFWSVFQLNTQSSDLLVMSMSVSGEAISAMLGFPIIGSGTYLLLKSHFTQPVVHLRMR